MKGKGVFFPRIPAVKVSDVGILQRDGQIAKKETFDLKDEFKSNI